MADFNSTPNTYTQVLSFTGLGISLIGGYYFSRLLDSRKKRDELKEKRLSFLDFYTLELNRLISNLDLLISELDEKSFFSPITLGNASTAAYQMQAMVKDIVIFDDESLRLKIMNTSNNSIGVINQLRAIEDLNKGSNDDLVVAENVKNQELSELRVELLKIGITIDDNLITSQIHKRVTRKELEDSHKMAINIFNKYNTKHQQVQSTQGFCKDKRLIAITKVLDLKNKLEELNQTMQNLKINLKSKRFSFFRW